MRPRVEPNTIGAGRLEQEDRRTRHHNSRLDGRVVQPTEAVSEDRLTDNGFTLTETRQGESHPQTTITKPWSHLVARPPARIAGATIDAPCFVVGFIFTAAVAIAATADGAAMFERCIFEQEITMVAGTKAHFVSCLFRDAAHVNNAGVAGDAFITACHRSSGVAHINYTVGAGETT